jgi:hypothetical protein
MADLPVVNALEEMDGQIKSQTMVLKDSISRLQSSIRQGLALNRTEIKASTSAILAVQTTLAEAFNINRDLIEIEKEKMRLAEERRREEDRKKDQTQKKNEGFIAKAKGGLFDVLKKVFFGTALVGAAMVVLENWETIVETFEKLKPTLIALKEGIVEFASGTFTFIVDNFDTIAKTFAGIVAGGLLIKAVVALKNGYLAVSSAVSSVNAVLASAYTAIFGRRGLITKSRIFLRNVRKNVSALATAALNMGKASIEWAKSKGAQLVKLIRAVVLATTIYATTTLAPALASLQAGLIAAAPFVAIAAGIALVIGSLVNAIGDAKDKFEETGSVTEALKEGLKSLFANIIGLPIKLIQKVGQMMGLLDDPTAQIEETQTKLEQQQKASLENRKKIASYQQELEEAKAYGMEEEAKMLEGILKSRMEDQALLENNVKSTRQELVDLKTSSDPVEKIKGFLDSLDPEAFLKNLLRSVLPVGTDVFTKGLQAVIPNSVYDYAGIDKATGEVIAEAVKATATQAGAEVDVRSREVASQVAQPSVTVAAPQTSIQTDNSTRVNKTSVASASPRRDKKPWWAGRNYATN